MTHGVKSGRIQGADPPGLLLQPVGLQRIRLVAPVFLFCGVPDSGLPVAVVHMNPGMHRAFQLEVEFPLLINCAEMFVNPFSQSPSGSPAIVCRIQGLLQKDRRGTQHFPVNSGLQDPGCDKILPAVIRRLHFPHRNESIDHQLQIAPFRSDLSGQLPVEFCDLSAAPSDPFLFDRSGQKAVILFPPQGIVPVRGTRIPVSFSNCSIMKSLYPAFKSPRESSE